MTKVSFCSRDFERSHARAPRGFGTWAFRFDDQADDFFVNTATFTEAKHAARVEAARRNASVVRVQP